MNRRGYFFVIDAVIASVILFSGLFILFSGGVRSDSTQQPLATIEDLFAVLTNQPVSTSLDPWYVQHLLQQGLITNPEITPLELITQLNYTDCGSLYCDSHAKNYTESLLREALGDEYGAELIINGSSVARIEHPQNYLLVRQFVVFSATETGVVDPLIAELRIWG